MRILVRLFLNPVRRPIDQLLEGQYKYCSITTRIDLYTATHADLVINATVGGMVSCHCSVHVELKLCTPLACTQITSYLWFDDADLLGLKTALRAMQMFGLLQG